MSDSLGSSVRYPVSLASGSLLPHRYMPVELGYTRKTQSLIHELREEYNERWWDVIHTEAM